MNRRNFLKSAGIGVAAALPMVAVSRAIVAPEAGPVADLPRLRNRLLTEDVKELQDHINAIRPVDYYPVTEAMKEKQEKQDQINRLRASMIDNICTKQRLIGSPDLVSDEFMQRYRRGRP